MNNEEDMKMEIESGEGIKVKKDKFNLLEANVFFLLLAIAFIFIGGWVQSREILSGLIITEYLIIALPILLYAFLTKKDIVKIFRFKKIPLNVTLKTVGIGICLIPTIMAVNLFVIAIMSVFDLSIAVDVPTAQTGIEFLIYMLVISVSPGICEEIFFRGMMLNAYEKNISKKWGVILSAFVFGLFHFNLQNIMGPIALGLIFGYLVQITGSIYPAMIAHGVNNGISVLMGYLSNLFVDPEVSVEQADILFDSPSILFASSFIYGLFAMGFFVLVWTLIKSIKSKYPLYQCGSVIIADDKKYTIYERNENEILMKNESSEKYRVTIDRLVGEGYQVRYKLWDEDPKEFKKIKFIPILITIIAYIILHFIMFSL